MTHRISKMTSLFALLVSMTAFAAPAKADIYQHIDELAVDIQTKSRELLRETVHYRYTPQYRALVACTQKMYRLASHIHDVTHFEGNLTHLASDLRQLDHEFHALEDLFDQTEIRATCRVVGNTAHVKALLNEIEDCIHHLKDDVEKLRRRAVRRPVYQRPVYQRPVVVPTPPVAPCPYSSRTRTGWYGTGYGTYGGSRYGHGSNYNRGGIGFSIGGGSSQIHFRF